jgi:hypothetical protein
LPESGFFANEPLTGIVVGVFEYSATAAFAAATGSPELAEPVSVLAVLELVVVEPPDELHAARTLQSTRAVAVIRAVPIRFRAAMTSFPYLY